MFEINITTEELAARKKRFDTMRAFGEPDRQPMICFVDIFQYLRMKRIECEDYMNDPKLHLDCHFGFQKMLLEQFATDQFSINIGIDMFVVHIANAFGAPIRYIEGSLPWSDHWLHDEKDLLTLEKLDIANNGLFRQEKDFRKYALEHIRDYPVLLADGNVVYPLENMKNPPFACDGVFSIAQMIMGMDELYIACIERPEFVHKLIGIITEKYIEHWKDIAREFGVKDAGELFLADDSAVYMSTDMFAEFSVPYMKRVRETFPDSKCMFHLCDTLPDYVEVFAKEVRIDGYSGFKPNKNMTVYDCYKPVSDRFGNKMWIYPDTDPCIVDSATPEQVYDEVIDILRAFDGSRGVLVSFSTWSAEKSRAGMQACIDYTNNRAGR